MAYKSIIIKAHPEPCLSEWPADAAITPGHILEINSTSEVKVHATAGGMIKGLIVALENSPEGQTITDAYAAADRVYCWHPRPGDEFYGLVLNGENIAIGDVLESGASGTLRKLVADTSAGTIKVGSIVGVALTAVDMSGSDGEDPTGRIRVLVI